MQTTKDPSRRTRENYTPGHSTNAVNFMSARTIESHAGFLLPLLDRGLEVLDVGCGPGTITQGIAEYVLPGRVTAVDRDPVQAAHAARLAEGREQTNLRFIAASVYELPFPAASFDLVFSHALFEHLSNPRGALAEIRRVLRPGGLVALCSPDWDAFEMRKPTPEAEAALRDYRELQEHNGGDTRAGGKLTKWLQEGEFGFIRQGQRVENYESTMRIATYLALQLESAGNSGAAHALLDWSTEPGAELIGCWRHVVGIKWNR
ncbi:MAG: class I SAM-dependent methyltransferase [Chthoniobacterales bacterium]